MKRPYDEIGHDAAIVANNPPVQITCEEEVELP